MGEQIGILASHVEAVQPVEPREIDIPWRRIIGSHVSNDGVVDIGRVASISSTRGRTKFQS